MKSDVKTSLLLLKNKLLLLSLVSTLGATSIGCSSNSFDNDEVESILETTEEKIEESISQLLWVDDGIAKHITGYTKDVPVTVTSVTDAEVNGIKMKKFEGKLTLAKSSSDTNTTWDCYIYGYVLEAGPKTVGFFGLEQEQSQPADKIELIKKNMDAMVKTIKLI